MAENSSRVRELAALYLRLGLTAFGGPAAHLAMMHAEVVTKRAWLTKSEFLDLVAAANFIPGPNSTEVAIHIGYRRAGIKGLVVAGVCFILPAMILCMAIAALYVRFGKLPVTAGILYGIKPVVIAVVCQALFRLGRGVMKSRLLAVVAVGAALVNYFCGHELLVLFGAGLAVLLAKRMWRPGKILPVFAMWPASAPATVPGFGAATIAATTTAGAIVAAAPFWKLFLVFLKIGSVLFGSGYVLLAFLQADLVDRHHWISQQALLDSVAVGQITPGPVFTTATFIGYVNSGFGGAMAATLGIFLPAFFFVAITAPILPWLRKSKVAGAFLDGLNAGSLALMAVVTVKLSWEALVDLLTIGLAVVCLVLLMRFKKLNSAWLLLAGGLIGAGVNYWR